MITIHDLRTRFLQETYIAPVFANREPYISYIRWLEKKIIEQENINLTKTGNNDKGNF